MEMLGPHLSTCSSSFTVLLLLFIIYKRTEDKKNALAFAVDPEDDIRENFINYDEEGGEEDQTAFDVTTLRKPVQPSPIIARPVKPLEEVPRRAIPRGKLPLPQAINMMLPNFTSSSVTSTLLKNFFDH